MGVSSLHSDLGLDRHRVETYEDLPQSQMHAELARRRVYVHLTRWTSLGLSLFANGIAFVQRNSDIPA